ncbi:S26 family signal peptidase [Rubripirellula tenax]|uniref:S26 family signal peptidase n=1 Tax=Rubripirellula tenax TaxID=2528015 RepID=UPI0011B6A60E|nr:S26 family signal peptidase [Rubripirellula tenax]
MLDHARTIRRAIIGAILLAIGIVVHWTLSAPKPDIFRITGASMAPTMMGETRQARCQPCGLDWPVDAAMADYGVCWHCGEPVKADEPKAGDRVEVRAIDEIRTGDLVAFHRDDLASVKRIVGVPGATIGLRGLELRVNDRAIRSEARLPVDLDDHRAVSRWRPTIRSEDRHWSLDARDATWIVYHHASVHDQNRPSPVWDDYPVNLGLSRPLESVQNLELCCDVIDASTDAVLRVLQYGDSGICFADVMLRAGEKVYISADQLFSGKLHELAPETPIAFRIQSGSAAVAGLSIYRSVLYRLRRRDDRSRYPIALGDGQYFVLGDNVPISIDSRDHGPIPESKIIGKVVVLPSSP